MSGTRWGRSDDRRSAPVGETIQDDRILLVSTKCAKGIRAVRGTTWNHRRGRSGPAHASSSDANGPADVGPDDHMRGKPTRMRRNSGPQHSHRARHSARVAFASERKESLTRRGGVGRGQTLDFVDAHRQPSVVTYDGVRAGVSISCRSGVEKSEATMSGNPRLFTRPHS